MTKILICDDEGIVQESVKFMIQKSFGDECKTESAKNGRTAIELAESFRPDIILMDIQMPGINGIEAMQEIRRENKDVVFIVLTAYDKFEYSQRAIDMGVLAYLTKPINRDTLTETLKKAMGGISKRRKKLSYDLRVKEKLETVIPIMESGFVYAVLLGNQEESEYTKYRELLDIQADYAYVMVIECGDEMHKGELSNTVGAGIRLQKQYSIFREMVKEDSGGIVGALMANKATILVPEDGGSEDYDKRITKIDCARRMLRKLEQQLDLKFKMGIGSVCSWSTMPESYREALDSLREGVGKVTHAKDLPVSCVYEEDYPVELEKQLFEAVSRGRQEEIKKFCTEYMEWMKKKSRELDNVIRLKTLEFVLWAEHLAYMQGGMVYRFADRKGYWETVESAQNYEELELWFIQKMTEAGRHIARKQQEKTENVVDKAKSYILNNFSKELSLDETAKVVGISPYYLSKLFKESEGINYIEYVTKMRIDYAKHQLFNQDKTIKEICRESGYSDPNYFSRIFKKWTGTTPTEFRESGETAI